MGKYAEYGRELHTLPHRDNLDANDSLLFYQGGEYKQLELNKIQALQSGIELNVTAPEGSVISVSGEGMETFSKTGGTVQFSLAGVGTYTVSATKDGRTASETLVVDSIRVYNVTLEYYHIYGIRRDQNSSSPEWTRTDDSVGFEAVASVGNTTVGHSDFDDKYPWCDMKRYIMSTNDVMVYIPEFWYKRVVDGSGIETIQIATAQVDGFTKHPGSGAYVGAYKWSEGAKSISGVSVRDNISLNNYRSSVASKGAGWCLHNIATWSAIQMLYLVEYANNNSQAALGYGILSTRRPTGTADNVAGLTGRPAGTDSQVDVVYRGIEGLWGNYAEWTDGLNIYEGAYYICTNPSNFASNTEANYTMLSYSGATNILGNSIVYIMKTGYDPDNSWCMLPVVRGGSATTYCCDATYITNNWNSLLTGGSSSYGDKVGIYCAYMHHGPNYPDTGFTSRITYYPALDPNNTTTVTGEWTYSN